MIGFGKAHEYGLGNKFSLDEAKENYRFNETPNDDLVPKGVRLGMEDSRVWLTWEYQPKWTNFFYI